MKMKDYYRHEWRLNETGYGNKKWAAFCKEQYRLIVMAELKRPYKQFFEALKQYPAINLN